MSPLRPLALGLALALIGATAAGAALPTDCVVGGEARTWSIPLDEIDDVGLAVAPDVEHDHDEDHDDGDYGVDLPVPDEFADHGELAAISPLTATGAFTLAAVTWLPDQVNLVTEVVVRVRIDGQWGEWFDLGVVDSGDPGARVGSEPLLAPGADGVQARVETTTGEVPRDLRIDLVEPETDGAATQASFASAPRASASVVPASVPSGDEIRPPVVTRAQWGADEKNVRDVSRSSSLKAMYVHHTVNANTYTAAQVPAMMRSILSYHLSLGWPDIGYQFLVDRFGTVYEGRRGSLTELVVGAQAGGYNTNTIGVSGLGRFDQADGPSQEMVDAIVSVLAWQAHRWGLDPTGMVSLQTGSSTGSGTRWKPGEWTDPLPVIRGHRDTNVTACPGTHLYALLPAIREAVELRWSNARAAYGSALAAPKKVTTPKAKTPILLTKAVALRWKAVKGAARYQVLVRKAPQGKKMAKNWAVLGATVKLGRNLKIPQGEAWSVAVRAVSPTGALGPISVYNTISRAHATGALVRTTGTKRWTKVRNSGYYRNMALTTTAKGAKLSVFKGKDVRALWIIAPSGPGYGRVNVFVGKTKIKTVKLAQRTFQPIRRIKVTFPKPMSGTVKVKTVDRGKLVRVSALVLQR